MSSESEGGYTPGPWGLDQTVDHIWIGQKRRDGSIADIVVSVDMDRDYTLVAKKRALANANLIAAAPDLVEALQWALSELRGATRYTDPQQALNCFDKADTAIARALGTGEETSGLAARTQEKG